MQSDLGQIVSQYFAELDESIDRLSHMREGKLVGLPSWVHRTRRIVVGVTQKGQGVAVKVTPADELEEDDVAVVTFRNNVDLAEFPPPPLRITGSLDGMGIGWISVGDMSLVSDNQLAVPISEHRFMCGWGGIDGFNSTFSVEKAKEDAIALWNSATTLGRPSQNYVQEVRAILERFQSIIKRKAFLERRVHRFISEYKHILLPSHKAYYEEHNFVRGDEVRRADVILEREQGLLPLLIELESPVHRVLRKNGDLTAEATHAIQQIAEWVAFIQADTAKNAAGHFSFLRGSPEKLVIMGRGLEYKEALLNKRFIETTIWTYDILLEEAKQRLNSSYAAQCQMLSLPSVRPF